MSASSKEEPATQGCTHKKENKGLEGIRSQCSAIQSKDECISVDTNPGYELLEIGRKGW
jgi:hypothetical protein